jgi:hypothetical protein
MQDAFCNIHELSYQTKATRKEKYHNNFGCYIFVPQSEASYPVPAFQKKWPGSWMKQWFYVKNDLNHREDVKGIIQRSISSHFDIRSHPTHLEMSCKHAKLLSTQCVPTLAQDT